MYEKFERSLDRLLKKAKTFEAFIEAIEKRFKMTFTEDDFLLSSIAKDKWHMKEKGEKTIEEVLDEVIDFTDAYIESRDGRVFKCPVCSDIFTDVADRITCSKHCQYEWILKNRKYKDTDIERIMEKWLKDSGVVYEKQKYLSLDGLRTVADFFIPDRNIALYADGDFSHSFPEKKMRDVITDIKLVFHGYEVLRMSGTSLKDGDAPLIIMMRGVGDKSL